MRRLAVGAFVVVAAGFAGVAPAAATCMDHVNRGGVHVYSCAAPGGEPATYVCVRGTCVST